MKPDVKVHSCNEGASYLPPSLYYFETLTDAAREWAEQSVPDAMPWGNGFVVEHRFARDVADGMMADGLAVE